MRLRLRPSGPPRGERPDGPFTGYKLAHAVLSADGTRAGFAGLTLGSTQPYGLTADACCVWNSHHAPPRRWCGCGFYCLHALGDAVALGCATENRAALLLVPVCERCADGRPALTLSEFAARLDGLVRVERAPADPVQFPVSPLSPMNSAELSAEIALLHARLDDLQSRLDH